MKQKIFQRWIFRRYLLSKFNLLNISLPFLRINKIFLSTVFFNNLSAISKSILSIYLLFLDLNYLTRPTSLYSYFKYRGKTNTKITVFKTVISNPFKIQGFLHEYFNFLFYRHFDMRRFFVRSLIYGFSRYFFTTFLNSRRFNYNFRNLKFLNLFNCSLNITFCYIGPLNYLYKFDAFFSLFVLRFYLTYLSLYIYLYEDFIKEI
jgi:hypothetical protein